MEKGILKQENIQRRVTMTCKENSFENWGLEDTQWGSESCFQCLKAYHEGEILCLFHLTQGYKLGLRVKEMDFTFT